MPRGNPGAYVTDFSFIGDAGKILGGMVAKYPELKAIDKKARADEGFKQKTYDAAVDIYSRLEGQNLQKVADHMGMGDQPEEAKRKLMGDITAMAEGLDAEDTDSFYKKMNDKVGFLHSAGADLQTIGHMQANGFELADDAKADIKRRRLGGEVEQLEKDVDSGNITGAEARLAMQKKGMDPNQFSGLVQKADELDSKAAVEAVRLNSAKLTGVEDPAEMRSIMMENIDPNDKVAVASAEKAIEQQINASQFKKSLNAKGDAASIVAGLKTDAEKMKALNSSLGSIEEDQARLDKLKEDKDIKDSVYKIRTQQNKAATAVLTKQMGLIAEGKSRDIVDIEGKTEEAKAQAAGDIVEKEGKRVRLILPEVLKAVFTLGHFGSPTAKGKVEDKMKELGGKEAGFDYVNNKDGTFTVLHEEKPVAKYKSDKVGNIFVDKDFNREAQPQTTTTGGGGRYGASAGATTNVPTIKSQAEYDALSPGDEYIDGDGKKKRKK
jgi:hypothetical protein